MTNRVVWKPNAVQQVLRDKRVRARLEETAELVADRARARVHVDEGETRDSIHVESTTTDGIPDVRVVAGGATKWLELGTERSRPFPFLRPALAFIRKGSGGSQSGLRVRRAKSASRATARNRAAAKARRNG